MQENLGGNSSRTHFLFKRYARRGFAVRRLKCRMSTDRKFDTPPIVSSSMPAKGVSVPSSSELLRRLMDRIRYCCSFQLVRWMHCKLSEEFSWWNTSEAKKTSVIWRLCRGPSDESAEDKRTWKCASRVMDSSRKVVQSAEAAVEQRIEKQSTTESRRNWIRSYFYRSKPDKE